MRPGKAISKKSKTLSKNKITFIEKGLCKEFSTEKINYLRGVVDKYKGLTISVRRNDTEK